MALRICPLFANVGEDEYTRCMGGVHPVHASSNCQIARISRDDVFRLCMCSKTVLANLMRITADRFMSLERLAEFFGVTRSALSRELSAFEESGRIERNGRRIRILRREEG